MPFIEDLWLGTQAQVEGEAEVPACYLQVGKPPSSYPGLGRGCLLLMVDECYAGELDLQPLEAFWLVVPTLAFLRSQTEGWKGSSERLTPVPSQRVGLQQGLWEPQELPFSDCLLHALCLNESEAPLEGRKVYWYQPEIWTPRFRLGTSLFHAMDHARKGLAVERQESDWLTWAAV